MSEVMECTSCGFKNWQTTCWSCNAVLPVTKQVEELKAENERLREWKARAIERARDEVLAEQASEPDQLQRLVELIQKFDEENGGLCSAVIFSDYSGHIQDSDDRELLSFDNRAELFDQEQASEVLEQIAERLRLRWRTHRGV